MLGKRTLTNREHHIKNHINPSYKSAAFYIVYNKLKFEGLSFSLCTRTPVLNKNTSQPIVLPLLHQPTHIFLTRLAAGQDPTISSH